MIIEAANSSGGGSDLWTNLGTILTGITGLVVAMGTGIGFLVRQRNQRRTERLRAEAAAALAAQEAKKTLEARLEAQHAEQVRTLEAQIQELRSMHSAQVEQYKNQITDLQRDREQLLSRILREYGGRNHGG